MNNNCTILVRDSEGLNVFTTERLNPINKNINGTRKIFCFKGAIFFS
jgi:hypothetical protein